MGLVAGWQTRHRSKAEEKGNPNNRIDRYK
jgi:hypothetical protein